MSNNKQLGSTLIIAGTTVGAGILALPIISAGEGFPFAAILLVCLWAIMLYGALLLLEVNLMFPHGSSFSTLGKATLGRPGQFVTNFCMVALFYCLSAAYISGGTGFLSTSLNHLFHTHLPSWVSSLVFTGILGALVSWKTYAVDLSNRVLLTIKMIAFFTVIFLLLPHIDYVNLVLHPDSSRFVLITIPIFFTAFGFHGSIPSIVKYIGQEPKHLRRIFIIGSLIPLALYLLWEIICLGILPQQGANSFASIAQQHGSVETFIATLASIINRQSINFGINFFTDIAMTTSFLGVNLGLFDFFSDIFNKKQQLAKRLLVSLITFIPPLLFAIFYPKGFILALGYAAIPLALLALILPALMAWRSRLTTSDKTTAYQVAGGKLGLSFVILFGLAVITLQILSAAGQLPHFD